MPRASAPAAAATPFRTYAISSASGVKISLAEAIWLGWTQLLPEKDDWRRYIRRGSRRGPCGRDGTVISGDAGFRRSKPDI
jgi:hypothetical protein